MTSLRAPNVRNNEISPFIFQEEKRENDPGRKHLSTISPPSGAIFEVSTLLLSITRS